MKTKFEIKRVKSKKFVEAWDYWNIIRYNLPDGTPYTDYGNFKDGQGTYNVLDEKGNVCMKCTENANKKSKR